MIHLYDKNDDVLFLKMVIFQFATLNKQRVTPDNVDTEISSLPLTFETQSKETGMIWHNHFGGLVWKPLRYGGRWSIWGVQICDRNMRINIGLLGGHQYMCVDHSTLMFIASSTRPAVTEFGQSVVLQDIKITDLISLT